MRRRITSGSTASRLARWFACLSLLSLAFALPAAAQSSTVQRTAKGDSGKDIRIGIYVNVQANCSSGALPSIQMLVRPESGTATVKRARISLTNYKNCMALEVPAFIGIYRSKPHFAGNDRLTWSVTYPNGRTEKQEITITVGPANLKGRDI